MSDPTLSARHVLVTGAASGIGAATAERLAGAGADLVLVDISDGRAVRERCLAYGRRVRFIQCDVSDAAAVRDAVDSSAEWLGGLDAVLHVAGIVGQRGGQVDELDLADWNVVQSVNLTGAFLVAKYAVPHLERSRGALVLTGSGAGIWNGHESIAYGASKGGLHGLMLTLEGPLRARGIRVNDVAPGAVDTPMARTGQRSGVPLLEPEAVAAVMCFLASPTASAVRGTIRTW